MHFFSCVFWTRDIPNTSNATNTSLKDQDTLCKTQTRPEASFTKNKSPATILFFLKTDCAIHQLTRKKHRRVKNNRSQRFIFGETCLWTKNKSGDERILTRGAKLQLSQTYPSSWFLIGNIRITSTWQHSKWTLNGSVASPFKNKRDLAVFSQAFPFLGILNAAPAS